MITDKIPIKNVMSVIEGNNLRECSHQRVSNNTSKDTMKILRNIITNKK